MGNPVVCPDMCSTAFHGLWLESLLPTFSRKAANKSLATGVAALHPCSLCGTADNPPREPHQNAILRVEDTSASGDAIENVAHVLRARGCRGRSCPNREAGRRPPGPSLLLLPATANGPNLPCHMPCRCNHRNHRRRAALSAFAPEASAPETERPKMQL